MPSLPWPRLISIMPAGKRGRGVVVAALIRQAGFTLIEMAMVIVIMGLIVGGGVLAIGPVLQQAYITQTNVAMDQIESSLVLFVIRNYRLPCPADGSLANTSTSYGLEDSTTPGTTDCTLSSAGGTANRAVIPWKTLGLDETYSLDGWGNRISYFVASNTLITGTDSMVISTLTTTISGCAVRDFETSTTQTSAGYPIFDNSNNCFPSNNGFTGYTTAPFYPFGNYIAVYSASSTTTELTQCNDYTTSCPSPASTPTSSNVNLYGLRAAYVLISHGKTGWYGWSKTGSENLPYGGTTYTLKQYNSGGTAGTANNLGFVQGTGLGSGSLTNSTYFDDIVRWRSPAYVIQNCGSAACGNP